MGETPCERCPKCGSDIAEAPGMHGEPRPHRMVATPVSAKTDEGDVNVGYERAFGTVTTFDIPVGMNVANENFDHATFISLFQDGNLSVCFANPK